MRQKRKLAEHVWYHVRTAINNREPVFQLLEAVVLFYRVLIEAKVRFPFEMCGLTIGNEWLSFYIKPADGYELPKIMQWMKQTFSCRFNVRTGRLAVTHLSSAAHSMPPHRGTVFKQRPHRFGRFHWWGGGDGQEECPVGENLRTGMGQPPPGGRDGKGPFFVQNGPRFRQSTRLTSPSHNGTHITDIPNTAIHNDNGCYRRGLSHTATRTF
jgi:REP element-mobilizing transposase RayT